MLIILLGKFVRKMLIINILLRLPVPIYPYALVKTGASPSGGSRPCNELKWEGVGVVFLALPAFLLLFTWHKGGPDPTPRPTTAST